MPKWRGKKQHSNTPSQPAQASHTKDSIFALPDYGVTFFFLTSGYETPKISFHDDKHDKVVIDLLRK